MKKAMFCVKFSCVVPFSLNSSLIRVHLFVSDLLALRTEAEWEEVRLRISELPQDDALTAEFSKVLSCSHWSLLTQTQPCVLIIRDGSFDKYSLCKEL